MFADLLEERNHPCFRVSLMDFLAQRATLDYISSLFSDTLLYL